MIGKILSHFRVLEKLGEGGMRIAYRAEDQKLGEWQKPTNMLRESVGGSIDMRRRPQSCLLVLATLAMSVAAGVELHAAGTPSGAGRQSAEELTGLRAEYGDVLALEGTAKQEILAIARLLRASPSMAVDQTRASGEYCLKSGAGTMVHFTTRLDATSEDIVYEFDATELMKAGLQPERLPALPGLGKMSPGRWYYLAKGTVDPHHEHPMPAPEILIAVDVR